MKFLTVAAVVALFSQTLSLTIAPNHQAGKVSHKENANHKRLVKAQHRDDNDDDNDDDNNDDGSWNNVILGGNSATWTPTDLQQHKAARHMDDDNDDDGNNDGDDDGDDDGDNDGDDGTDLNQIVGGPSSTWSQSHKAVSNHK